MRCVVASESVPPYGAKRQKADEKQNMHCAYDVTMRGDRIMFAADGKIILNEKMSMRTGNLVGCLTGYTYSIAGMQDRSILVGSFSGKGTGISLWKKLRIIEPAGAIRIIDFRLDVEFAKQELVNDGS